MPAHRSHAARILLAPLESRDCPSTFTVTNTADNGGVDPLANAGTGTFRQAIIDANANAGIDTIAFNIPGTGIQTILPAAQLPTFQEATIVDGYTQPGSSPNTLAVGNNAKILIEFDGNGTGIGIGLNFMTTPNQFDGFTVRGLSLVNFNNAAVSVFSGGGAYANFVVEGNYIGVRPDGVTVKSNNSNLFLEGDGHRVGGTTPAARNVLSGSVGHGATLAVSNSVVQGNYIGTNATGQAAAANAASGINLLQGSGNSIIGNVISGNTQNGLLLNGAVANAKIQGNFIGLAADGVTALKNNQNGIASTGNNGANLIGGTTAAQRNIISGNGDSGLQLDPEGQEIRGNFIGTDVTGTVAVPNNMHGIYANSGNHKIADNVISGNVLDGIHFENQANPGAGTVITGNKIGTDVNGTADLGNLGDGIFGGKDVLVGGTTAGTGNIIAFNGKRGVAGIASGIGSATGLQILGNSIFDNDGLGIELIDLLTPEVRPTLTRAATTQTGITISGRFQGVASVYRIEYFASPSADPSGFGEGKLFLGSTSATSDGSGVLAFSGDFPLRRLDSTSSPRQSQARRRTRRASSRTRSHRTSRCSWSADVTGGCEW